MTEWIGQSPARREDERFITGTGRYLDDLDVPGEVHAHVLRSVHAHAEVLSIDSRLAETMPGVVAVLTGRHVREDGVPPLPCCIRLELKPGTTQEFPDRFILAQDRVRYFGEPVALVLAETLDQAEDAAAAISIEYRPLPCVVELTRATAPDAPRLHETVADNLNFTWEAGDAALTDAAFDGAARVVRLEVVNNRLAPSPLEPRGAIGLWDDEEGYTLHVSSQGAHWIKDTLCRFILTDVPADKVRVVTPDVGGGFGVKIFVTPEYVMVLWAARRTGRPVRWISGRSEAFLSDTHGRDNHTVAEVALDPDALFLALRVRTIANMGAYLSEYAPTIPTCDRMHEGAYVFPAAHVEVQGVFTNTGPVDSYRGAGRPEANYMIERLVDLAGRETGIGPLEIRRRNMVTPGHIPYASRLGHVYDSGNFPMILDHALADADWDGFPARRAASASRGMMRGIGLSSYVEVCAYSPGIPARIETDLSGRIIAIMGTQSSGQGHETAYAQILADELGIAMDDIVVRQGDTRWMRAGSVTAGSRSIPLGGVAACEAARDMIERGRAAAASVLGRDGGVFYRDGAYHCRDTNRHVSLAGVANAMHSDGLLLFGESEYAPPFGTFTNGCHVCEVEIDPASGEIEITDYVAVDDFGRVVNPMLVRGQVHGGVAQGLGQALLECVTYDASGRLETRSFHDYALPAARNLPGFRTRTIDIRGTNNAMGMKGVGEAGAIAAPPAVINAVLDALWPLGVRNIDMPATSEKVWKSIAAQMAD